MMTSNRRSGARRSFLRARPVDLAALAGAAISLSALAPHAKGQTWINTSSGTQSWNTGTNWSGAVPPTSGTTTALILQYFGSNVAQTSQNNIPTTPFVLNSLTINNQSSPGLAASGLVINSAVAVTNDLAFDGVTPTIFNSGSVQATIAAILRLNTGLTISGAGNSNLIFGAAIQNGTSTNGLTIGTTGNGIIRLDAANTFGGTFTLNSGNVQVGNAAGLGTGNSAVINGGTLRFGAAVTLAQNMLLNSNLNLVGVNGGTFGGILSGAGGININTTVGTGQIFTFTSNNTFGGAVNSRPLGFAQGSITLSGNGAFSSLSSFTMSGLNSFVLDNAAINNTNRVSDSAPVSLNTSSIRLTGNAAADSSESAGALTIAGNCIVQATAGAGRNASWSFASAARSDRGVFQFAGTNLGNAVGANNTQILLGGTPTLVGGGGAGGSSTISVIPFATATNTATGGITSLATYDATNGVRPLTALEYLPTSYVLRGTTTSNNVRMLQGQAGMRDTTQFNAVVLDSPSAAPIGSGLYGSGVVRLTSGALLTSFTTTASTLPAIIGGGTLDFGGNEGVLLIQNLTAIQSTITGSNGLTRGTFDNNLILAGNNTFTGQVTLNSGTTFISRDSNLGNAANSLLLNMTINGALTFAPSTLFGTSTDQNLTIARNITIGAAGGTLSTTLNNTTFQIDGLISGSSYLRSAGGGVLKLTNASNSYAGPTICQGLVAVTSDGALGSGGDIVLAGGTLRTEAAFSTSRNIDVQSTAQGVIITSAGDLTLNGQLRTQSQATLPTVFKSGPFALIMTANNPFNGNLQIGAGGGVPADQNGAITGGSIVLSGPDGALASANAVSPAANATLILDNTGPIANNNTNRLSTGTVTLFGGNLVFKGNSFAASSEQIGALGSTNSGSESGGQTVTISAGAGQSAVINAATLSVGANATLTIRGTNLGTAAPGTANVSNLVFGTAPTLTNSIIPRVVGATSDAAAGGTDFVTYGANGVSLLGSRATDTFGATTNADIVTNQVLGAATSANSIRMNGVDINATGQTLTVGVGGILSGTGGAGSNSITGGTLALGTNPAIFTNADLTISSAITAATNGLTKTGNGNLTLSGANTGLTGGIIISGGRLIVGSAGALNATTPQGVIVTHNNGNVGTLDLNGNSISVAGIRGYGNVDLNGANLTITGAQTFNGSILGTGNLNINSATTLAGVSSFDGDTTVTSGVALTISANQPTSGNGVLGNGTLGSSPNRLILGNATTGAILAISGNVGNFNSNIVVPAGTGSVTINTPTTIVSNTILGGSITMSRAVTLGSSGFAAALPFTGCYTLGGNISDGTAAGSLTWFAGSFNLWGNNSYSGGTTLNAGSAATQTVSLGLGSDTALGSGPVSISNIPGAIRADNGARTLANNFAFTSTGSGGLGFWGVNDLTVTGSFGLGTSASASAKTLQVLNTGNTTLAGPITGDANTGITKTGGGTLIMSNAANSFAGPVVINTGTLLVNGNNTGAGAYTVNAGAILGGNGSIAAAVTVNTLGAFEPGASPGTLTTGAMTLGNLSGATFELAQDSVVGGGVNDLITVNGTLSLAAASNIVVVNIVGLQGFMYQPVNGNTYTLFNFTSPGGVAPLASNFQLGFAPAFITGATFVVDTASTPNRVLITPIPTPGAVGVLGLGGLLAFRRRRR